jgi:hypothetical protein
LIAVVGDFLTFVRAITSDIGTAAARLVAGLEHLLTLAATKIALRSPIAEGLPMFDVRLPPVADAADGIRRPTSRAVYDVIPATAPIDVAAPIISPIRNSPSSAKGKPCAQEAIANI